jgi:hypothetical protein
MLVPEYIIQRLSMLQRTLEGPAPRVARVNPSSLAAAAAAPATAVLYLCTALLGTARLTSLLARLHKYGAL